MRLEPQRELVQAASSCRRGPHHQVETDRYWSAITGNGGHESACGWCKDKLGMFWQITPIVLTKAVTNPDPGVAKHAFDATMLMKKVDIAAVEAARRG